MIRGISEDVLRRVYDFSEMTNEELRCKFFQKLQECIDLCNNASDILEWVKNEGLEKEVNELLSIWLEDGTLEGLINIDKINKLKAELLNEINKTNEQIETVKNECTSKINKITNDKRVFKPVFGHCVDWSNANGNYSEQAIIKEIDKLKDFGVEEISVTIQTNCSDDIVTLVSDLDLFKRCLDYAQEKGIKTTMIKIHCNAFRNAVKVASDTTSLFNQWYAIVDNVSNYFKDYCEYFVPINEGEHIFKEAKYETFLTRCLNICKEKGYKTGFTPSTALQWDELPTTVRYNCDFISFNCYPNVSLKGLNTSYGDVVNAFEEYNLNNWINSHKEIYGKEIIITEIGVEDRASCLACTYVWDFGNGESFNDGKVQKIMLKGIFESLKDNDNFTKMFYWFPFRGDAVKDVINYYVGGAQNE